MTEDPAAAAGRSAKDVRARLLARGFEVLFQLGEFRDGAKLTELSQAAGLSRATLLRILRTLIDLGAVRFDESARLYRLGPAITRLADRVSQSDDLVRAASPILERLRDETGETTCLFQRQGLERVCTAAALSPNELGFRISPGQRREMLVGAPGRLLAAFQPAEDQQRFLAALPADRRGAITSELAELRVRGAAWSCDEIVIGGAGIAAPVRDRQGRVDAVLTVLGPTARLGEAQIRGLIPVIQSAAEEISAARGWRVEGRPRRRA